MKFHGKTTQSVKCGARVIAVFAGLLGSVLFAPTGACAQAEIDPDHFDSPTAQPIRQMVRLLRYDGAFSLPYSVQCRGKVLAPGKYFVSFRSYDGKVGRATLKQEDHAIEIADVVETEAPKQRDEVVFAGNNERERTLSMVRVSGFSLVFDPKYSADPPGDRPARTKSLPLKGIVRKEIATQVPSLAPPRP